MHIVCYKGFETARALAMHGAHVVIACRDMVAARTAIENICQQKVHHTSNDHMYNTSLVSTRLTVNSVMHVWRRCTSISDR